MSIIVSILQAIAQAISYIFPISESGHSAIFHNLSGRLTDACSQLTGVIHIGIAIGIIIAFYKLFINLFKNFFKSIDELFHKQLDLKNPTPSRAFMYSTLISFVLFVFYLIPTGKYINVFHMFHRATYNFTLLGEGICFVLTGLLIIVAFSLKERKSNLSPFVQAVLLGFVVLLAIPTGGCSVVAAVICIGILLGMSDKHALRYAMVISVPTLIVIGVVELCVGVTTVSIVQVILALVFSILTSFLAVKTLIYLIKNKNVKIFGIYDISVGLICTIIGIVQIIAK